MSYLFVANHIFVCHVHCICKISNNLFVYTLKISKYTSKGQVLIFNLNSSFLYFYFYSFWLIIVWYRYMKWNTIFIIMCVKYLPFKVENKVSLFVQVFWNLIIASHRFIDWNRHICSISFINKALRERLLIYLFIIYKSTTFLP